MNSTLTSARLMLAVALAGFGLQYLTILPLVGPPWYPANRALSTGAGILLLAAAAGLLVRATAHLTAWLLGAALLLRVLIFHLPQLLTHLHDPTTWAIFSEMLALAGGAWMIAAALPATIPSLHRTLFTHTVSAGRYIFAVPLVIFGILHFKYAFFISNFIPRWIPGHFFFANFVGLCFIAAALAIASGVRARLAASLLAAMFLLWLVILHAPLVAAAIDNGNEWTSMFVTLAVAGSALAAAASSFLQSSRSVPQAGLSR